MAINSPLKNLGWRLLLSYLGVMVAILGISAVAVYEFFSQHLYQQFDQRLSNLAESAAHSLTALKQDRTIINKPPTPHLDEDGDLDIPWQNLRSSSQSVEWFGSDQQPIGKAGNLTPNLPLKVGFYSCQQGQIRTLTIPAYSYSFGKPKIEGYIRVSESSVIIESTLSQLRWGFGLGGIIALILTGVGGKWLTRQSLKPVEQSFQQLKQFTADASHELRSPLTAIKTSIQVMQTHPERIHPADLEKLNSIISATDQMRRLVEDLLLLARTDKTTDIPMQEWNIIPLNELLEDVIEFLEPKAEVKEITVKTQGLIEVFVKGDSSQLSRLFTNLIDNALQYTPEGGKVIVNLNQTERFVIVSITDTGIGIDSQQLPYIFDRFWRAEQARSYRCEGSGLGLAIAQAIAHRHQGEITVSSQLGVGSCFRVRLSQFTIIKL